MESGFGKAKFWVGFDRWGNWEEDHSSIDHSTHFGTGGKDAVGRMVAA
jgi:hypothetical protein